MSAGRLRLVPPDLRAGSGGKVIGIANAGRPLRVGVSVPDSRHHLHVLGPTGTGKTSLLLRMILDDATAGRGVAVFDSSAKADLVRDLLNRLPASCAERLVIIDPDEKQAPPAINLLDPGATGSPHQRATQLTSVMAKVWWRWWGPRTADIAHHALLTLACTPGATLAQLPRLLSDTRWRTARARAARDRLGPWEGATLGEFWHAFHQLPAGARAGLVAPLLSKLRLVLAHPFAAALLGTPATTFTLTDVLDGGILLVRLPRGVIGDDAGRLVGSMLLSALWQATTTRAALPESERLDAAIYLDEAQHVTHLPIGLDDALAEARGLHTSFVLAHQYLAQLTDTMAAAVDANARTKVYFALAPDDARRQARHVAPYLDDGDLARLGAYEAVLRPIADGRALPPVTVDTLPSPPPVPGRAEALRRAARHRTGLDRRRREQLAAEHRIASGRDHPPLDRPVHVPSSGAVDRSLAPSLDDSVDSSVDLEDPGDWSTPGAVNGPADGGEEDPWAGTDW